MNELRFYTIHSFHAIYIKGNYSHPSNCSLAGIFGFILGIILSLLKISSIKTFRLDCGCLYIYFPRNTISFTVNAYLLWFTTSN